MRAAILLVFALPLVACESTGTDPVEPAPLRAHGSVGPAGGTLSSADGTLVVTFPPGALSSDKDVEVAEIAVGELAGPLAGYPWRTALRMGPEGLALAAPVTISLTLRGANKDLDGGTVADLIFGFAGNAEAASLPDQETRYDLDSGETRVDLQTLDPFAAFGTPDPRIIRDDFGKFAALFAPPEAEIYPDTAFTARLQVEMPNDDVVEPGSWEWFAEDSTDYSSSLEDGDALPAEREAGSATTTIYSLEVDLIPARAGTIAFSATVQAALTLPDLDVFDLPDLASVGDIEAVFDFPDWVGEALDCALLNCLDAPVIETGFGSALGMAVAKHGISDPAPVGPAFSPWLYVIGDGGIQYHRLLLDQAGELITGTELVSSIQSVSGRGVNYIAYGQGENLTRVLFFYGDGGGSLTYWSDTDYGIIGAQTFQTVHDAQPYGSDTYAPGFTYSSGAANFPEYQPESGFFSTSSSGPNATLTSSRFPDATGSPRSTWVDPASREALVLMDGSPGQIWYHPRSEADQEGTLVGVAGNDPRHLRGEGSLFAVTNQLDDSISVFTWAGGASITSHGTVDVGTGPIGLDVTLVEGANALIATTSAFDGTILLTEVDLAGSVVSQWELDTAPSCDPDYVVFVRTPGVLYAAASCSGDGAVEIFPVRDFRSSLR